MLIQITKPWNTLVYFCHDTFFIHKTKCYYHSNYFLFFKFHFYFLIGETFGYTKSLSIDFIPLIRQSYMLYKALVG